MISREQQGENEDVEQGVNGKMLSLARKINKLSREDIKPNDVHEILMSLSIVLLAVPTSLSIDTFLKRPDLTDAVFRATTLSIQGALNTIIYYDAMKKAYFFHENGLKVSTWALPKLAGLLESYVNYRRKKSTPQ